MDAAVDALLRHGVVDGPHPEVDAFAREARFVDHHVHSIRRGRLTRDQLVLGLSETDRQDAADVGGLDHQLGDRGAALVRAAHRPRPRCRR